MLDYVPLILAWVIAIVRDIGDLFNSDKVTVFGPYRVRKYQQAWTVVILATAVVGVGVFKIYALKNGKVAGLGP